MRTKRKQIKSGANKGLPLLISIIMVFCILGTVVFSVARKTNREMSAAAIQNLNESLDLVQCTIEAILNKEAEFQKLMALEIARWDNPEDYVRSYQKNRTMVKIALVLAGETEGISSTGDIFRDGNGLLFGLDGRRAGDVQLLFELYGHVGIFHQMSHSER